MIRFLIKKTFFDGWDNFFPLFLLNIIYALFIFGSLGVLFLLPNITGHKLLTSEIMIILISALFLLSIHSLGVNSLAKEWSCYRKSSIKDYFKAIKKHFLNGIVYFIIHSFIVLCFILVIPIYFEMGSILGLVLGIILFWVSVTFLLSMQFYYPLLYLMEKDSAFKTLKKSFIVLFDNPLYALFLFIRTIIDIAISLVSLTFIPGLTGINLSRTDMMKLIMMRYDYMEENKIKDKKLVIWNEVLYNERLSVGTRSIKDMLFPWRNSK